MALSVTLYDFVLIVLLTAMTTTTTPQPTTPVSTTPATTVIAKSGSSGKLSFSFYYMNGILSRAEIGSLS
jgi:hypothetical protein